MYSLSEKRDEIQKVIDNTRAWIADHGPGAKHPWPQHECDIKQRRLDVFKEIRDDLELAIERKRGAA